MPLQPKEISSVNDLPHNIINPKESNTESVRQLIEWCMNHFGVTEMHADRYFEVGNALSEIKKLLAGDSLSGSEFNKVKKLIEKVGDEYYLFHYIDTELLIGYYQRSIENTKQKVTQKKPSFDVCHIFPFEIAADDLSSYIYYDLANEFNKRNDFVFGLIKKGDYSELAVNLVINHFFTYASAVAGLMTKNNQNALAAYFKALLRKYGKKSAIGLHISHVMGKKRFKMSKDLATEFKKRGSKKEYYSQKIENFDKEHLNKIFVQ